MRTDSGLPEKMTATAAQLCPDTLATRLASRGDLTAFLMQLAAEIGADSYMLVATVPSQARSNARIVASNWIFDTIELIGRRLIAALAQGPHTAAPGMPALPLLAAEAPAAGGVVTGEEARLLDVLGHAEIYALQLDVGRQRLFMLFSAEKAGSIDQTGLTRAQLKSCYALSQTPQLVTDTAAQDTLSERERECLFWVSEGKTTDEVAVILGVSANTVNSYITHAMQKLSASNRPMAIATAMRNGII
ncbi:DNA-binding CsgD family transcriptional regulator [Aquamicrobium terrae]